MRAARKNRGWTQDHLARAAGVDVRTIRRAEANERISDETRMALAAALDVVCGDPAAERSPSGEERSAHPTVARPRGARLAIAVGMVAVATIVAFVAGQGTISTAVPGRTFDWRDGDDVGVLMSLGLSKALDFNFAKDPDPQVLRIFDSKAYDRFEGSAFHQNLRRDVTELKGVVKAVPTSAPVIYEESLRGREIMYRFRMPYSVSFYTADDTKTEKLNFDLRVLANDAGFTIENIEVDADS